MKRNYNFDAMRIVICLFVIAIHTGFISLFQENRFLQQIITIILFQCNNLFFMMSGYYNLDYIFENINDYKKYYKNKFINILFPYVFLTFVLSVWDMYRANAGWSIGNIFYKFYIALMDTNSQNHLWFMYYLMGMLLATPFMSKMLHAMKDNEIKLLFYIALGWNVISIYLCKNFGVSFRYSGWFLSSWVNSYFIGYYYKRIISKESIKKWLFIALIGFGITLAAKMFIPKNFKNSVDLSVVYILFCIGCFMFWDKIVKINCKKIQGIVMWLSKYTFYIYILHYNVSCLLRERFFKTESLIGNIFFVFATFICSLLLSIIVSFVIKPIQKILKNTL